MSPRIVVFGATGYTGRLVSEALIARGAAPVLAGRSERRLATLAAELDADLETAVADVADQARVEALVGEGDVLVSTVGPFTRWGEAAARAAIARRAHYLDSTGEPAFIRRVFERHGPNAERAGSGMLTAFGYDYVPGNLAAALALREAGDRARRVDVGYFFTGRPSAPVGGSPLARLTAGLGGMSGGTFASTLEVMGEPSFSFREGRLATERPAKRVLSFDRGGRRAEAISAGGSEHFALPRLSPGLTEVNVGVGWFGPLSRALQLAGALNAGIAALPRGKEALGALAARAKGSTGGPSAQARAETGSEIVAVAYDGGGKELARTSLVGVNGYTFTGEILAWGAARAAAGELRGAGALGPVDGCGLEPLRDGAAEAGLRVQ